MPKAPKQVLSHWYHLEDEFTTSAQAFYEGIEEAVRARELPEVAFERVTFKEGSVLSAKREYLRVKRGRIAFDVGAAPYGRGHFFSWWLVELPASLLPWIGMVAGFFGVLGLLGIMIVATDFSCAGIGFLVLLAVFGLPIMVFVIGEAIRNGNFPIPEEQVLATPFVGFLYERLFGPHTYYRLDTAIMFQESIRRALGEVLGETLSGQGKRALSEEELAPRMRILQ